MGDMFSSAGFSAAKQYGVGKHLRTKPGSVEEEGYSGREKGRVSNEQVVDMTSPNIDQYITALAEQDEISKAKKKYQPTVENLKERLEKALEDRYDNAHNMLAEAFYGLKVSTCSALLGLLSADPAELEAIKKKAYEQAKQKVQAGYERLAYAFAEYEIYAA